MASNNKSTPACMFASRNGSYASLGLGDRNSSSSASPSIPLFLNNSLSTGVLLKISIFI